MNREESQKINFHGNKALRCINIMPFNNPLNLTIMKTFVLKSLNRERITLFGFMLFASFQFAQAQGVNTNFQVYLSVNGVEKAQLTSPQDPNTIPTINMVMGDELGFRILGAPSDSSVRPKIYGLPKVWEAAFAGDMMYHVDPNFGPNTINPFIGLDSRVHTLMLKPFPEDFEIFEKDWVIRNLPNNTSAYEWSYTAQRQMDPMIEKYDQNNYYRWPKRHKNKDGTFKNQRQNQKEGLNMKFLYHWNDWLNTNFYGTYSGKANYMMGFDDDELAYFNHRFKETGGNHPLGTDKTQTGVAKLETLQWKELLEGETRYSTLTGYPVRGNPLNIMVNAYRKHQYAKEHANNPNTLVELTPYYGYEIQDKGTDENNPNGKNGLGNLAHPGLVTIEYGGLRVKVKLNVINPLRRRLSGSVLRNGFYDAIIGPDAPSNAETKVGYYLDGVENQAESEQRKYHLHYKWMNRLGMVKEKKISMYDIIRDKQGRSWTQWIYDILNNALGTKFDLERPAYAWITATYQRTSSSKPVIVAGKELNQIFLMFCGVKTLNGGEFPEGKGHGAYIWLEDFRSHSQGEFTEPKIFGKNITKYAKKYFKEYVFSTGDVVTFTTFDGDPHRLDNDEEEWYLSNRSMAKRVKEDLLWNAQNPSESYLKYYIGPAGSGNMTEVTTGRSGKELKHTFSTPGAYDMRVVYRTGSDLWLRIIVKDPIPTQAFGDYPSESDSNGVIETRELTVDEKSWLGLTDELAENATVLEVKEVKTSFAFKDGFRSYRDNSEGNKLANRWSKYNDYADAYIWLTTLDDKVTHYHDLTINYKFYKKAEIFLGDYEKMMDDAEQTWMWKDWANHYSSVWKGKLKTGSLDGLPPYTPDSSVTRLNVLADLDHNFGTYIDRNIFENGKYPERKKAPWQYVIPLVSTTTYHGYRQRTNPSCIYDMRKVFDENRGAFSGSPFDPSILNPEDIQAPEVPDEVKNKQEFYYNLKYGRIVVGDKRVAKKVRVYNVLGDDLKTPPEKVQKKFVAQKTLGYYPIRPSSAYSSDHKTAIKIGVGTAVVGVGIAFVAFKNRGTLRRAARSVIRRFRSSASNNVESQSESVELLEKCKTD